MLVRVVDACVFAFVCTRKCARASLVGASHSPCLLNLLSGPDAPCAQNVICFSMIPDLFPKNKAFALAVYNCAIYVGRGLMYVLITGARSVSVVQHPVQC